LRLLARLAARRATGYSDIRPQEGPFCEARMTHSNEQTRLMHTLQERVKELNCLYGISRLVETRGGSMDGILSGIAELIPPAWQYPESACACITVEGRQYRSETFERTPWRLAADIKLSGAEPAGAVEVFYRDAWPRADEGPFLSEERALLEAICERIGRIIEHKRSDQAVVEREALLSALSQKTLTVLEEERERVARDLHDSIGQQLAAMRLEILWIKDRLREAAPEDMFRNLVNMTLNASEDLKRICMDLRPVVLDKMGFVPAIEELIKEFALNTDMRITARIAPVDESGLSPAVTINIYRILQESLANAVRHAKARTVRVTLERDSETMRLCVEDDGAGMPAAQTRNRGGFGIMGIRERAKIIGGAVKIESQPGQGARIIVTFPANQPSDGDTA
jgi:signal transduction histidine kinase